MKSPAMPNAQLDLFAAPLDVVPTPPQPDTPTYPQFDTVIPAVSLEDYYLGLRGLLEITKPLNKGSNFLIQTEETNSPLYKRLTNQGKDVEAMRGTSQRGQAFNETQAKKMFANNIISLGGMVQAGMTKPDAQTIARGEYTDFTNKFFGLNKTADRDAKLKQVNKSLRRISSSQAKAA